MSNKLLKYFSYVLLAVSAIIAIYFYMDTASDARTVALLNWTYILFGLAIVAALVLPLFNMFGNPKAVKRSIRNLVIVVVVCGAAYLLASGDPVPVSAAVKTTPADFKMTDTLLIITYVLTAAAILAIIAGSIVNIIRNR